MLIVVKNNIAIIHLYFFYIICPFQRLFKIKMAPYRQNGIIYAEHDPQHRKSAVIFNGKYCLAPASLLLNIFDGCRQTILTATKRDLRKDLRINRLIDTTNDRHYRSLAVKKFKLIHEHSNQLYETNAHILYIFKSRNIWNSFNDILRCYVARSMTIPSDATGTIAATVNADNNDLQKLLLSSFVILLLDPHKIDANEAVYLPSDILYSIINDDNDEHRTKSPQRSTQKIEDLGILRLNMVKKMENLESISTPFGNECFLNTINAGKVANIFGDNNCLLVASMPLVFGCEGGAIYNSSRCVCVYVISLSLFEIVIFNQ